MYATRIDQRRAYEARARSGTLQALPHEEPEAWPELLDAVVESDSIEMLRLLRDAPWSRERHLKLAAEQRKFVAAAAVIRLTASDARRTQAQPFVVLDAPDDVVMSVAAFTAFQVGRYADPSWVRTRPNADPRVARLVSNGAAHAGRTEVLARFPRTPEHLRDWTRYAAHRGHLDTLRWIAAHLGDGAWHPRAGLDMLCNSPEVVREILRIAGGRIACPPASVGAGRDTELETMSPDFIGDVHGAYRPLCAASAIMMAREHGWRLPASVFRTAIRSGDAEGLRALHSLDPRRTWWDEPGADCTHFHPTDPTLERAECEPALRCAILELGALVPAGYVGMLPLLAELGIWDCFERVLEMTDPAYLPFLVSDCTPRVAMELCARFAAIRAIATAANFKIPFATDGVLIDAPDEALVRDLVAFLRASFPDTWTEAPGVAGLMEVLCFANQLDLARWAADAGVPFDRDQCMRACREGRMQNLERRSRAPMLTWLRSRD